jgi:hypothetical protein
MFCRKLPQNTAAEASSLGAVGLEDWRHGFDNFAGVE